MRRGNWFNPRDFVDMIQRFNPFGYKEADGTSCAFPTYKEVYDYTFKRLGEMFPRGYIDMVLFIHTECQCPHTEAQRLVATFKTLDVEEIMLVAMWEDDAASKNILRKILKALHSISDTKFNESMFLEAYRNINREQLNFRKNEALRCYTES